MSKKKVRGLLDFASLADDEWEYEEISPDYVPGLGLGATEEARRWAYMGYQMEIGAQLSALSNYYRNPVGRPALKEALQIDSMRAIHMWLELREMPETYRTEHTNRQLIRWMQGRKHRTPKAESLWRPNSNLERSLSIGRTFWRIRDDWSCPELEEALKLAQEKN